MVGKRGIIRVIEASLAILIIAGAVLLLYSRTQTSQEEDLTRTLFPILEEISKNNTLRDKIVSGDAQSIQLINSIVDEKIKNPSLNYSVYICNRNELCNLKAYPNTANNIYSAERIISSTLRSFNPKKIKIFLWRI